MDNRRLNIIVGLFVGLGSILIFAIVLLLGQEQSLFESTSKLYVGFEDVGGLKQGSLVRLAGVNVGIVKDIEFSKTLAVKKLNVEIQVSSGMMSRIREDSVATIATKGLLGDKVIELSIGSETSKPLKKGDYVKSEEPPDMFQILEEGQLLIHNGAEVAKGIRKAIDEFTEKKTVENVKGIIASLDGIFNEVEHGDGIAHGLIYSKREQANLETTIANLRDTTTSIKKAAVNVEDAAMEVRHGNGVIHGLIYEEKGREVVENLRKASASIADFSHEIQAGGGTLHTLIYEEKTGNIIRNLDKASHDIQKLAEYIEKGKGTVGALIKDPTIYEDIKIIIGNLKRNSVLKSLIRLSIEKNEDAIEEDDRIEPDQKKKPGASKGSDLKKPEEKAKKAAQEKAAREKTAQEKDGVDEKEAGGEVESVEKKETEH